MLKSFVAAMSTYSKIPMPTLQWDEKNLKYSMCWFPFVGVVIGLILVACNKFFIWVGFNPLLQGVCYTALPILVTGGIHMDGFMDTVDAKSSYGSKEKRLEILKDPHAGAFSILYCFLYLLVQAAVFASLNSREIIFIAMGYPYSRILSGLSVVTFPKAKKTGMLSDTAKNSAGSVGFIMVAEFILYVIVILAAGFIYGKHMSDNTLVWYGIGVIVFGLLAFVHYGYTAKKWFGGITGDLAGYFLQICELLILVAVLITGCFI